VAAAQQPAIVPNSPNDSSGPTDGAGRAASARLDSTVGYSSDYNGINSRREVGSAHVVHEGVNTPNHPGTEHALPTAFPTPFPTLAWDGVHGQNPEDGEDYHAEGTKHGHDDTSGNTLENQDTHAIDKDTSNNKHTFDYENFFNTTDHVQNDTFLTDLEDKLTASPTKAPTAYPTGDSVVGFAEANDTNRCEGTKDVGQKYACAGDDYCKQCECALDAAGTGFATKLVSQALASYTCATPTSGSDVCENVNCTVSNVNGSLLVHVLHKKEQLAFEGGHHNCKAHKDSHVCTCYCHGDKAPVWHSYEDWHCATNGGEHTMPSHISYSTNNQYMTATHPTYLPGGGNTNTNTNTTPVCKVSELQHVDASKMLYTYKGKTYKAY
jgi:hypothetical protein